MLWIKRIALGLAALLLLLVVAAAVFVATFDVNRYKPLAVDWMKAEYQRTLSIDGPIELSVFPRLAVKVTKLRLSERGRADSFASIDEASLSLAVLPLLRKELVVDRVSARGVRALLTRDAKGVRNIDDLLKRPAPEGRGTPAPADGGKAMRFNVGGVTLENMQLTLRDETARLAGTVTLASFTSGRLTPGVETPLALKAQLELAQPQSLKLALEGKTALAYDDAAGSIALRDAKFTLGGDTVALKGVAATLDAKRLVVSPQAQKLELEALKLTLSGKRAKDPFEMALDWPKLAVAGEQVTGSAFSGRVKLEGATALNGRFESGAVGGSFEALRLPGFALGFDGSAGMRKLRGDLKSNLLLHPAKAAATLERLALRTEVSEPGLAPLLLQVAGQVGVQSDTAQWTLQGALNQNRFESQGRAAFGAGVPNLQASARFDRLDLNRIVAPAGQPAGTAQAGPGPADAPVALDGLAAVDGRFGFTAGQLMFRQYKVDDAKLDATLDSGTLRIVRLAGRAWGGTVDASGSAEARAKRIAVKLNASGVNINALLNNVAGKDLLEGTGRVSAELVTTGATVGALRSNLSGSAALQLRDGAVKGVNLARTLRQAKAALTMKQDAVSKAQATEKTDFSELNATARIAGGVAESNDLEVKSPFLRIGGAGKFDIGRGRIDYTARATVTGAPTGQDGAELAALRGVTVPVQLSGPFEAIDWKVQWSGVAAAAVEQKLKDKLAERLGAKLGAPSSGTAASGAASAPTSPKDAAKDKLKEKLKGLLGK